MNLNEQIEKALAEYDALVDGWDNEKYSAETKAFVKAQVRYAAEELLHIAQTITDHRHLISGDNWFKNGRQPYNFVHDHLLPVGQRFSSILFSVGLRDKITYHIEHNHGINFSGLGVWPVYIDNRDNTEVFLAYDGVDHRSERCSFYKNGVWNSCTAEDWQKNFTKKA